MHSNLSKNDLIACLSHVALNFDHSVSLLKMVTNWHDLSQFNHIVVILVIK